MLDYYNKLDTMREVFDIDRYKKDHQQYLYRLVSMRNSDVEEIRFGWFREIYGLMLEKYPGEMKTAEETYRKNTEPVPRSLYNLVNFGYGSALRLISVPNSREMIIDFFKNKGVEKIYVSCISRFGKVVKDILSSDFVLISKENGCPEECDVSLILSIDAAQIRQVSRILKNKGAQKIYSINDVIRAIQ